MEGGRPTRAAQFYAPLGAWFEAHAYPSRDGLTVFFRDVTEERRAEELRRAQQEALRLSEARLRLALDASGLGTWSWEVGSGTDRLEWDARCKALFGFPAAAEATYSGWRRIVHPDDLPGIEAAIRRVLDPADPDDEIEAEYRILRGRQECWIAVRGRALFDPDPASPSGRRPVLFLGTAGDATARRRTERALREREELLTLALEAAELGTLEVDLRSLAARRSQRAAEALGVPFDTPLGHARWREMVHPDDRARVQAALRETVERGVPYEVEYRVLRDGGAHWVAVRAMRLESADGPARLIGIVQDVTERKRAEAALAESEARLKALVETVPDIVWEASPDGTVLFMNARWYAYTGQPADVPRTTSLPAALHPEDRERNRAAWRRSMETGEDYEAECRIRRHDGAWRWFLVRGHPVRGEDGRIARWIGAASDIDDVVRAREALARQGEALELLVAERTEALRESERRLAQAQKLEAVGQLTGGVAHDFNNLLTAVAGNLELIQLAAQRRGDSRTARLAGNALRAAERGGRLTAQLLAFSRRQALRPERAMATALIAAMDELIRRAAGEAVRVEVRAEPSLAAFMVDPAQFESALLNLVLNARDAMPEGGWLTIRAGNACLGAAEATRLDVAPGRYVRVEVADTGTGIAPEHMPHLFEPFFTTKEVGRGSGLGLAQVHGFVRQSGGAVAVESAPGRGTAVSLYLPALPEAAGGSGGEAPRATQEPRRAAERPATILLVDDDADVREAIALGLAEMGHRVITAGDGREALALLGGAAVDLVLSDIGLPGGMDGVALARELRRRRPELRVLLSSGYADEILMRHAAETEFAVLRKPYARADLLRRIAELMAAPAQA